MSLTAVGSIAFDSVKTPFGEAERELGGSAIYAAVAASHFTDAFVVGPVGEDFAAAHTEQLTARGVDIAGVEEIAGGKTFNWRGHYGYDMNAAHSDETELNVFDGWLPTLPEAARGTDILFLASMDPEAQAKVHSQWNGGKWSALDTMTYWIEHKREALIAALGLVDIALMNDQEARELTRQPMLLAAAREIMAWGPRIVVIKQGEYGSALVTADDYFSLPGYPLEVAADPTGTGDSFAGGMLGCLDRMPEGELHEGILRRAVTYGSVMASFCVEEFGPRRVLRMTQGEIDHRFAEYKEFTHFEHVRTKDRPLHPDESHGGIPMPHKTGGTPTYETPHETGGTPQYDPVTPSQNTPNYREPHLTPGTQPLRRPGRGA